MTKEELVDFLSQIDSRKYLFDCPMKAIYNEELSHKPVFERGWLCLNGTFYDKYYDSVCFENKLAIKFRWGHIFIYPKQTVKSNSDTLITSSNISCDNTIKIVWVANCGLGDTTPFSTPVTIRYDAASSTSITGTPANFRYPITGVTPLR